MSNSPLVTYTCLSPNCNKPRNHKIDTITIHHMAGNLSVQTCGSLFAKPSRKASSNYGVNHKEVGLYVDEANRSWCSSNGTNDNRAITIETANDSGAPDWHIADDTMDTLIKLVTDICKRNCIEKLIWSDNKNDRINHVNGCNMTIHSDFAATACPGPYLKSKMAYIAQKVNEGLFNLNNEGDDHIRYNVQIGSYKLKANAEAQLQKAKNAGFTDAFIKEVNI